MKRAIKSTNMYDMDTVEKVKDELREILSDTTIVDYLFNDYMNRIEKEDSIIALVNHFFGEEEYTESMYELMQDFNNEVNS